MYLQRDDGLWNLLKQSRMEYIQTFTPTSLCSWGLIPKSDMSLLVNSLEQKLGMKTDINIYHNMTLKALKAAEQMLFYIVFCPPKDLIDSTRKELENSIKINTPKEILIILNRLTHAPSKRNFLPHYETFKVFLDKISSAWNLRYKDICKLTGKQTCKDDDCDDPLHFLEEQKQGNMINHPVHVFDDVGDPTPSSFIPFCWFGKTNVKAKSEKFSAHVCNSFKPKLMNDQVCFDIDPNKYLQNGQNADNIVLYLLIDDNKDRQILDSKETQTVDQLKNEDFMPDDDVKQTESLVYLNTIGKSNFYHLF